MKEVKQSNKQPKRAGSGRIRKGQSTRAKSFSDDDLLDELPDVPTTKID